PAGHERMVGADLEDRRRMVDAAVEQRCIAHGELQRRNGNALTEADRHRLERTPARTGIECPPALLELNLDLVEEAHLLEPSLLPLRPELIRDLCGADIRAFHHDLGHGAGT